jgi:choline dehydrogenase-like flavoprotein
VNAVLAAVCDTLVPALAVADDPHGFFAHGASQADTADRVARLIERLPDPRDRARIGMLLRVLDSSAANFLLAGRPSSFVAMDGATRESVLRGWAESRLPLRRAGFQALKRLTYFAYYCWPTDGRSHPAWRAVGYPGPLPFPEPAPADDRLPTVLIERDTTLDCDVVVVGSGAGGGVAAGVLAQAGRSVVVLEKGANWGPRSLTQVEGEMFGALYLDGGTLMTQSGTMPVLAGSCVGGGTAINYTTSFPLPESTRAEWDVRSGLALFGSARFAESLARVAARLDVNTRFSEPGTRDAILERGCRALGWHVDVIPRNVTGCRQGLECGYCGYGCRHGAKNTTASTYLADAVRCGGRIVARCDVDRVLTERGRATGVVARVRQPDGTERTLTVRARAVIAACGAVHTPALLVRSGLAHPRIGAGLRLHPATAVVGVFPERVEPWSGALQTRYSDQLADLDQGYGAKFETAPVHFALAASGFGWAGSRAFKEDVAKLAQTSLVGVLLRDRDAGRIEVGRDGRPRVHYELSGYDIGHLRRALRAAADVLAAAGATELRTLHTPPVRARPGERDWRRRFGESMDRWGYRHCRMAFITFHQMASCAMGAEPRRGVVGETGESFEATGLFVADGSAFPTSSGVNPMITIMAIADHVARGIAERW